ncbi:hypothetical protein F4814DRAFT_402375 [Daldinia grandis]|nr:hypothetical protein F4814DRAFT_402375 [Daldinia grandis]
MISFLLIVLLKAHHRYPLCPADSFDEPSSVTSSIRYIHTMDHLLLCSGMYNYVVYDACFSRSITQADRAG